MKAVVCTKYGSPNVLKLMEVEKPSPNPKEILIKVYATTVTSGDVRVRKFESPVLLWIPMRLFLGIRKPRKPVLGVELAGEVEAVGKDVRRFKKGDKVFAMTGMKFGAHAEYISLAEDSTVEKMPDNLSYEEAAAVLFGGTTALHFLRKANLKEGQKVLIYGASGSVGTSAVQIARHFGAKVTGVCSAVNFDLVKSLGASHVIDYRTEEFTELEEQYDVIFDAVGKISKAKCKKILASDGSYVSVKGQGVAKVLNEDLLLLKELIETGRFKSVIDKTYTLGEIAEAHRYVEQGHKKGNVVISVRN
ncbi:NADPH:quinone reductase-like Zn-dependent oxidoreductase [Melghiribacillus thermohalophilus]|uniref:NADPH:quinone reductase-like Zn-dependent oxidoreductase n=1 Tax=Melghiribacillus thermohalophilus TaxID=1324956 RepID=A0A4R3NA18_9BACI|nr:NAD(P)-dependent alcohol dehydrogenase [Melghiribacillus thermohalophilus]TCT25454.1 NADPH:quinone reductase-like Zn-dependent oxidoreductase [Melghiribacillus thermohalophilus]